MLTRLHARYGKADVPNDLVFAAATPISAAARCATANGELEDGAAPASYNNFQGRYAIRHAWTGPIACTNPRRGRWGGSPPAGTQIADQGVMAATNLAFAPRGKVELQTVVAERCPSSTSGPASPCPASPCPPERACTAATAAAARPRIPTGFVLGGLGFAALAFTRRRRARTDGR